ncbi:hypothetical protein [Deinococcus knuensis]|nr:hypothetical protein [Deinococcus knuensis]
MYNSDLDLYTKARLWATQEHAHLERPAHRRLGTWVRRAARRLSRR